MLLNLYVRFRKHEICENKLCAKVCTIAGYMFVYVHECTGAHVCVCMHVCLRECMEVSPGVHKNTSMQRLISSLWGTGTAKFQVTWLLRIVQKGASVWQCCAVDRYLMAWCRRFMIIDEKPKTFYSAFSFFFLHENLQRGCIRVRKLGDLKADTHGHRWKRRMQENGLAKGVESYVTSLRKATPLLALWHVFHVPWWYIFYLKCAFASCVTWNSAVPDPNVWCCILLFVCTLGVIYNDMPCFASLVQLPLLVVKWNDYNPTF